MTDRYTHLGPPGASAIAAFGSSWAHSACDKVDFLSPWQALQDAEDLAIDVGSNYAFRIEKSVLSRPKRRHFQLSFSEMIEICLIADATMPLTSFTMPQTAFEVWNSKPWSLNLSHQLSQSHSRTVSCDVQDVPVSFMQISQVRHELPPPNWIRVPSHPFQTVDGGAHIPVAAMEDRDAPIDEVDTGSQVGASSSSSHTMRAVYLHHLEDPVVFGRIDWTDYDCMMADAARLMNVEVDDIVALYEINVQLPDLPDDVTPLIVHLEADMEPGEPSRLCLVDYEMHGNTLEAHYQTAPVVDRRVMVTPIPASMQAIFVRAGVDVYCHLEDDRCLIFHNHQPVLSQHHPLLRPTHGDYLKLVVPPSLYCDEPTQPLLARRQQHNELTFGDSPSWSESSGYSPSLIDPSELRAQLGMQDPADIALLQISVDLNTVETLGAICRQPLCLPPQLEDIQSSDRTCPVPHSKLSFTEEFLRAVNAMSTAAENLPEFQEDAFDLEALAPWTRELYEHWNRLATVGPGAVERLGRLETWFTDHLSYQRCHHTRIAILGPDAQRWEEQIMHLWRQHILLGAPIEFHIVHPLPEDASGQIIGQLIVVQRPQRFQRSIVLSIYDSEYDRGLAHSLAMVMSDRIDLLSVMIMAELTEECPPEAPRNDCSLWFGARQFAPNERAYARHGHAFRLVLNRARGPPPPRPVVTNLAQRQAQLSQNSALPPFLGAEDTAPTWLVAMSRAFPDGAAVEREDEGPVAYLTTWFLHFALRPSCVQNRVVRLRDQPWMWHRTLIERWGDHFDSTLPVQFFWVAPMPPSSLTQHTLGHMLIVQGLPEDQVAALLTTRVRDDEGQALHHVATFLPTYVSAEMVVDILALPGPLRRFPRRVGFGQEYFAPYATQQIHSGSSLVLDVLGSQRFVQPTTSSTDEALNLIQTMVRRIPATHSEAAPPIEVATAEPAVPLTEPAEAFQPRVTLNLTACLADNFVYKEEQYSFPEVAYMQVPNWPAFFARVLPSPTFIPEGLKLHPTTYSALASPEEFQEVSLCDCIALYVDGAADGMQAAWSIVFVHFDSDGLPSLQGCVADQVVIDTTHDKWLGANRPDNIAAEVTAACAAMAACLGMDQHLHIVIRPDLKLSAQLATHQWGCTAHPLLCQLCETLGSWFKKCRGTFLEVRGHCGDPWNELADGVAKHCMEVGQAIGFLDLTGYSDLIKTPDLNWAWLLDAPTTLHQCLPPGSHHGVWQVQPSTLRVPIHESYHPDEQWKQMDFLCMTANVLALGSVDADMPTSSSSERALRLAHQWHQDGIHVAGLQETRREVGTYTAGNYKCFASGAQRCSRAQHFGCELWIHQHLVLVPDLKLKLADFQAVVTHADPRRLIVNLTHRQCRLSFIVLHVPCKTSQCDLEEIRQWWTETHAVVSKAAIAPLTWIFIDANAPLASHETTLFSTHGAEPTNGPGELLEAALTEFQWYAPTTMTWCHTGSHATWTHPRGAKSRRDYILTSAAAHSLSIQTWVAQQHDGGFSHEDHLPVCLHARGWIALEPAADRVQWDSLAFLDPVKCQQFQDALETLPIPAWPVHVDAHADQFESNLLDLAKQFFTKTKHDRVRPRLRESTRNLIALKRSCLDYGRQNDLMHDDEFKAQLKLLEKDVRRRVHLDQQIFYDDLVQHMAAAGDLHDARTVYRTLTRLGAKKGHKQPIRSLPALQAEGGPVTSFTQQQQLWLKQFADVEAGYIVARSEFRRGLPPNLGIPHGDFDLEVLPTLAQVQKQLHKLKRGKAPGPDNIPPDVLKAGGEPLAKHLTILTSKIAMQAREPAAWRTGRLIPLHKGKLPRDDPKGYRSIFLNNYTTKILPCHSTTAIGDLMDFRAFAHPVWWTQRRRQRFCPPYCAVASGTGGSSQNPFSCVVCGLQSCLLQCDQTRPF